ncbi:MAG: propanediol utilization protein, partial [Oscillospiraceae bacterium]|nr:propanediol utilization protein [Oscillospiraceae bacterium]
KGTMVRVAVLGPERPEFQVELSRKVCVALGIHAPLRVSGDVANTPGITLINGERTLELSQGVIVAKRHIHMTPEDTRVRGLQDGQQVQFRSLTDRPRTFEEVTVRVSPKFQTYAHLDYDEANACGFRKGDMGMIL